MKIHINFNVLVSLLLFSNFVHGQNSYKKYVHQQALFHIDTVFNKSIERQINPGTSNHIWLTNLNGQYINTASKKINATAVPTYQPIPKNSLLNPRSTVNQVIGALLPYSYYFPAPATYTQGAYTPGDIMYRGIPYGYSQYSTRTIGAPHYNYMLPKF